MHSHTPVRYDNDSRRQTVTLPNGVTVTYGYDPDVHVTSITYKTGGGATIGTLNYGYDVDGRRVSLGGSLAQTNLPLAQSFSYNPDNSLNKLGSITVINHNDGNIQCMSTTSPQFSYDARGNLQQAVPNGVTLNYSYDALGRRYKLDSGVTNFTYLYDSLNPVETAFDGLTQHPTSYLAGLDLDDFFSEIFWNGVSNVNESVRRDALGSTVAVTDSSGKVLDQTTYDPYGNTADSMPGQASAVEFTGRENDGNSFYYMRGRYYAPSIARFISRDPAGLAGGVNMYTYAADSPTASPIRRGRIVWKEPGIVCATCVSVGPRGLRMEWPRVSQQPGRPRS